MGLNHGMVRDLTPGFRTIALVIQESYETFVLAASNWNQWSTLGKLSPYCELPLNALCPQRHCPQLS